jgi:hypothetical protein
MNSDFSERQFETAVNIELTATLGPHMQPAVPVVPTTNQEAEAGWDALFQLGSGYSYFLQYKVVVSASRKSHWNEHLWDVHRRPYFRFSLHSDSTGECRQHRLLSELRRRQAGVYYCVPSFVKEVEFWKRIQERSLFEGCRLIDLEDVPLRDHFGRHQVSFDDAGLVQVWSEPERSSVGERGFSLRHGEENRTAVSREAISNVLVDAVAVAGRARRSRELSDAWLGARVPPEARDPLREVPFLEEPRAAAPRISEALSGGQLLATAARVLRLDFGLVWVIEPAQ